MTVGGKDSDRLSPEQVEQLRNSIMTERNLQIVVEECLRSRDWFVYHSPDSRGSEPGLLDIVAVRPPRVLFVELKSQEGKLDRRERWTMRSKRKTRRRLPTQAQWFERLKKCPGVETYLWRPSDWFAGKVEEVAE